METHAPTGETFDIPGIISVGPGNGGLTRAAITIGGTDASTRVEAEIYLNGATITRYDVGGRPILFCSRTSKFAPGKAVRGGVPIIFPWFGPHPTDPSLQQHGVVRAAEWTLVSTNAAAGGDAVMVLALESSEATRQIWPYDFALQYTVTVGRRLEAALEVTNRSATEFRFAEALHTYLAVSDVRNVRITGLERTEYIDKVDAGARKRLDEVPLALTGETDRVFVNTDAACTLRDPVNGDTTVAKEGSLSTVVWNPWETKAEGLADLAGAQWPGMICIETCNAMENEVTLAPRAVHTMKTIIAPSV